MSDWWSYPTNFSNEITNVTNATVEGVGDFFGTYPASVVPGLGLGMVCIIWLVTFVLSMASGARKAMMVASFITGVLSVWLWRMSLIDPWIIFLLTALTIVGAIGTKEEKL